MEFHVARLGPDRFEAQASPTLSGVVRSLTGEVRDLLLADTDDPRLRRLFPPGYGTDEARDAEYQVLVRDELLGRRLAALDALDEGIGAEGRHELDGAALTAWMTAVNDVRLVLGTVLDVEEDQEPVGPGDPRAPGLAAYDVLTHVLARIVRALHEDLPQPGDGR
ncbi:MAG: DUF2017 family protein [Acidimicrobiia bacterium]